VACLIEIFGVVGSGADRRVPLITPWREVRGRPCRRDREDELYLAHVGRQADTATHRASVAGRAAKDQAVGQLREASDNNQAARSNPTEAFTR